MGEGNSPSQGFSWASSNFFWIELFKSSCQIQRFCDTFDKICANFNFQVDSIGDFVFNWTRVQSQNLWGSCELSRFVDWLSQGPISSIIRVCSSVSRFWWPVKQAWIKARQQQNQIDLFKIGSKTDTVLFFFSFILLETFFKQERLVK